VLSRVVFSAAAAIVVSCFLLLLLVHSQDHKDKLVRSTLISLFPKLANVNNVEFVKKKLLDSAMEYLTQSLKKSV
jgi:hypothetical protein